MRPAAAACSDDGRQGADDRSQMLDDSVNKPLTEKFVIKEKLSINS